MKLMIAALCSLSLLAAPVFAQDKKDAKKAPSPAQKAQQERMKDCNEKAADKKGDERKKFMSSCLKGEMEKGPSKAQAAQQNKMKECNAKAKGMKGDERKKFMSSCLSG